MSALIAPTIDHTPEVLLENYIAAAAARIPPIPVDSDEGKRLYRALAAYVWARYQRPVLANDIRDLWQRIDAIKRGSHVEYGIVGIHYWAADYANALASDSVVMNPDLQQRLAAWLDDWPNVCVLGQTGRGKSSTINRLFGVKIAEVSHHTSCTSTVTDYRLVTGSFLNRPTGVIMWDVPGYGDERLSWEKYVKLYRRLARKCDVVLFMLDNDRQMHLDMKMFKKLLKRVPELPKKLVVVINKADLFHPCDWDEKRHAPSEDMRLNIGQRLSHVAALLGLHDTRRVVPLSALKNWNTFSLLNAMVEAAGESKGANLLRAARPDQSGSEGSGDKSSGTDLARRFGISSALRSHFRSVLH
ncbi:MAG TPA: GTPase domain-containing protein [Planctomycetota bacterium]|nr:GTPase domain-containing protein [Planctomycetota bacterium]